MRLSQSELIAIRDSVRRVGRLSDSLIRVGPFSLGIDGVLSWIPGVGEVYSALAGGFIVVQGIRAGVPAGVLLGAVVLLVLRTGVTAIPIAGAAAADLFTAHKWASRLVAEAIDRQLDPAGRAAHPPSTAGGFGRAAAFRR